VYGRVRVDVPSELWLDAVDSRESWHKAILRSEEERLQKQDRRQGREGNEADDTTLWLKFANWPRLFLTLFPGGRRVRGPNSLVLVRARSSDSWVSLCGDRLIGSNTWNEISSWENATWMLPLIFTYLQMRFVLWECVPDFIVTVFDPCAPHIAVQLIFMAYEVDLVEINYTRVDFGIGTSNLLVLGPLISQAPY
jgi:hypothetical protein